MSESEREVWSFEGFELDADAASLSHGGEPVEVEPQVFDLLLLLVRNAGRVVSKDAVIKAVWDGRIVSDSAIATRVNAARRALGDDGKAQHFIKTVHGRGFRFALTPERTVGPARDDEEDGPDTDTLETPDIHYCTSRDGVHIAYAELGRGAPLVKAASYLTHLQHDSEGILFRHWIRDLSRRFRYIRYDQRGNGLSDWEVADISFEAMVADLEAVVDAMGLQKFTLLGVSQGASISIEFAHRYPEKVGCLVIYGGYAAGWRRSSDARWRNRRDALLELIRVSWSETNPAGRQAFASLFFPSGTPAEFAEFNELQQLTATPENAYRILDAFSEIDVRDRLAELKVPTLVLHCRNDAVVPFQAGREIAAAIPGASFCPLEGENHVLTERDPAWPRFLQEVERFVSKHTD